MKLKEIAERISAHLKRFENDPLVNATREGSQMKTRPYFNAYAFEAGRYVKVRYISYQGYITLTKSDAIKYLAWLDDGNVGKHHKALASVQEGQQCGS